MMPRYLLSTTNGKYIKHGIWYTWLTWLLFAIKVLVNKHAPNQASAIRQNATADS
jgi:hypothetical protein